MLTSIVTVILTLSILIIARIIDIIIYQNFICNFDFIREVSQTKSYFDKKDKYRINASESLSLTNIYFTLTNYVSF